MIAMFLISIKTPLFLSRRGGQFLKLFYLVAAKKSFRQAQNQAGTFFSACKGMEYINA